MRDTQPNTTYHGSGLLRGHAEHHLHDACKLIKRNTTVTVKVKGAECQVDTIDVRALLKNGQAQNQLLHRHRAVMCAQGIHRVEVNAQGVGIRADANTPVHTQGRARIHRKSQYRAHKFGPNQHPVPHHCLKLHEIQCIDAVLLDFENIVQFLRLFCADELNIAVLEAVGSPSNEDDQQPIVNTAAATLHDSGRMAHTCERPR